MATTKRRKKKGRKRRVEPQWFRHRFLVTDFSTGGSLSSYRVDDERAKYVIRLHYDRAGPERGYITESSIRLNLMCEVLVSNVPDHGACAQIDVFYLHTEPDPHKVWGVWKPEEPDTDSKVGGSICWEKDGRMWSSVILRAEIIRDVRQALLAGRNICLSLFATKLPRKRESHISGFDWCDAHEPALHDELFDQPKALERLRSLRPPLWPVDVDGE